MYNITVLSEDDNLEDLTTLLRKLLKYMNQNKDILYDHDLARTQGFQDYLTLTFPLTNEALDIPDDFKLALHDALGVTPGADGLIPG